MTTTPTSTRAIDRAQPAEMAAQDPRAQRFRTLSTFLLSRRAMISEVADKHLDAERLTKIALDAAARTPKLLECSPESLLAGLMFCAKVGLEPIGKWGVYLVPFKGAVTPIIDYRALIRLVTEGSDIETIHHGAVYPGDELEYELGDNPRIKHRPQRPSERRGERGDLEATYAIATLKSGRQVRTLLWREDIDRVRARSMARNDGPWVTDFEAMAIKTAIRALCNRLPVNVRAQQALVADDEELPTVNVSAVDVTAAVSAAAAALPPAPEAPALPAPAPAPPPERSARAQELFDQLRPPAGVMPTEQPSPAPEAAPTPGGSSGESVTPAPAADPSGREPDMTTEEHTELLEQIKTLHSRAGELLGDRLDEYWKRSDYRVEKVAGVRKRSTMLARVEQAKRLVQIAELDLELREARRDVMQALGEQDGRARIAKIAGGTDSAWKLGYDRASVVLSELLESLPTQAPAVESADGEDL